MNTKSKIQIIGAAFLCVLMVGCKVQPLHGTAALSDGSSLNTALSSVEIADPNSRLDQLVRNELQFSLTGSTQSTGDLPFELSFKTKKTVKSVGISDVDFGPRAFFVTISSDYILRDNRKVVPIGQGTEVATASYDRIDQEFGNVRAERDAEMRAAKAVALRLKQAIALALNSAR